MKELNFRLPRKREQIQLDIAWKVTKTNAVARTGHGAEKGGGGEEGMGGVDSRASLLCGQQLISGLLKTGQTSYWQGERLTKSAGKVVMCVKNLLRLTDLFEGLQHFLSLTKMSEE